MTHTPENGHFDAQDMRNMGGLAKRMKLTYIVYLAGALALAGIFPLAGFWSKDEILAAASRLQPGILVVLVLAAFLTVFYIGRQVFMVFFGQARSKPAANAVENPPVMTLPLIVLAILATIGGALNLPGLHTLETWLEHTITALTPGEFLLPLALIALAVALVGLGLAWATYARIPLKAGAPDPLRNRLGPVFTWMNNKLYVDEFYHAIVIRPYEWLADKLAHPVDLGVIDAVSNGLGEATQMLSAGLRKLQTGFVRSYALMMLVGVAVVLGYLAFGIR